MKEYRLKHRKENLIKQKIYRENNKELIKKLKIKSHNKLKDTLKFLANKKAAYQGNK